MTRERYCLRCHSTMTPRSFTRGSFWIELVLWCCFLLPGVLYSLWRLTTRSKVCRVCGGGDHVPLDSPVARAALLKEGTP